MKKEEKWKLHIITATAFVVFIVLGLACATSPKPQFGLSQSEMRLNDPRMPPDRFRGRYLTLTWYWLGSQAPELSADQVSSLWVSSSVSDLRIDGRVINRPNHYSNYYLNLPPGRHTLTFSYWEVRRIEANNGTYLGDLTIDFPNNRREIVMEPGKHYVICAVLGDVSRADAWTGSRTASTSLVVSEWTDNIRNSGLTYVANSYTPPTSLGTESEKYLEPYDSSLPIENQAFLETRDGIYIVGFNGDTVSWGWSDDYSVTIGVPEGRQSP